MWLLVLLPLLIAAGCGGNSDTKFNEQLPKDLAKYLDAIQMYRLIRGNFDENIMEIHDEHANHTEDDDIDELQGRSPGCARCTRARKRQRTTAKPDVPSFFALPTIPLVNWGENSEDNPRTANHGRKKNYHKKHHPSVGISVSGLYLAVEEGQYHDGGFLVPVYDSSYVNSHEYKRRRKMHDWLTWADKVEEKTEDPCFTYVICQIGLNPNDFGRLGDDLRRLIRRPTIYLRNLIQRYFKAISIDLTKINFGACKNELRACMISSDKQRWVDMGFPLEGVFTEDIKTKNY